MRGLCSIPKRWESLSGTLDIDFRAARRTIQRLDFQDRAFRLEQRFLALLEAVCTQEMRRLGSAHRFFNRKGKDARTDFGKFIARSFCEPIFSVSQALFNGFQLIHQRRMLGLQRHYRGLSLDPRDLAARSLCFETSRRHAIRSLL